MEFEMPDRLLVLVLGAALLGVLVGTCSGCASAAYHSFTTRIEQWDRSVELNVTCGDHKFAGSGVIIDQHRVLTARHVVPCAGAKVSVTMFNGRSLDAVVDVTADKVDLARLRLTNPGESFGPFRPIIPARVFEGDTICFQPRVPNDHRVCAVVTRAGSGANGLEHDGLCRPGNSGSGVYDRRGRLVGIVTRRRGDEGGLATAISPRRWLVEP